MRPLTKTVIKPFRKTRRQLALLVIATGLCTFFVPMVILDSPVINRTGWSAMDIASKVYERTLPISNGHFDEGLLEIAALYVLMVFALIALYFPGSPRPLLIISTVGFALSFIAKWWDMTFLYTFGWNYWGPGHMKRGLAWWILPWIMPALLAICFAGWMDLGDNPPDQ